MKNKFHQLLNHELPFAVDVSNIIDLCISWPLKIITDIIINTKIFLY